MLDAKGEGGNLSPLAAFNERLQALLQEIPEEERRLLVVIAGHNGAGKTTIYRDRLSDALADLSITHLNPDEIEKAITRDLGKHSHSQKKFAELAADEATRLRHKYLDLEVNFSFETVFSDPVQDKVRFMEEARSRGYFVLLIAVGLDSIELSKARVAIRHAKGGHNVPEHKIESRYERVLVNLAYGAHVATLAIFFDNSESRGENDLDTYWDIAFFENGEMIAKDDSPPGWWHQVESTFNQLNTNVI